MDDVGVNQVLDNLRSYGLEVTPAVVGAPEGRSHADRSVMLETSGVHHVYRLEVVDDVGERFGSSGAGDLSGLLTGPRDDILVVTPHVSGPTAEMLRHAGVNYVDTSGNAFVSFASVLIDIRGRRRPAAAKQHHPRRTTNLFSPKRAQVIFALLSWNHLARRTVLEVARAAGVSQGQAYETLTVLRGAGYVTGEPAKLGRTAELLDRWAGAYPQGLSRTLDLGSFRGEITERLEKATPDAPILVSGEWASGEWAVRHLMRPTTMTLYVTDLDRRLAIANRWRTDGLPNIFIRRKFWSAPDGSDGRLGGVRNAPWPLVYADLLASGEPRQLVAAQELRATDVQN